MNIGIYIDADNVSYKISTDLINYYNSCGNIFIKKIFGDWSKLDSKNWIKYINSNGLEPIQCFRQNKKQSTDICLITHILNDLYHYPVINHYVIVSSDSDYIYACQSLKKLGKKVVIIGSDESLLKNYGTEYINMNKFNTKYKLDENHLDVFKNSMNNNYMLSKSKFNKYLKKFKNINVDFKKIENYFDYFNKDFHIVKKNTRIYIIYISKIRKEYGNKENFIENISSIRNKLKDILKLINENDLLFLLFN